MFNRIIIASLLVLLSCGSTFSQQFNRFGNPIVTYYESEDFNLPEQTWCITKDNRGVMYFGTSKLGILEYDGKTWRTISTNSRKVSSLGVDSAGVVYVGLMGDFGYLIPDNSGSLKYTSLATFLPDSLRKNIPDEVQNIICHDSKVYFCSRYYIYIFDQDAKAIQLPRYSFRTFLCDNELLVGNYDEGLIRIIDGTVQSKSDVPALRDKDVFSVLPINNKEYWVFAIDGIYRYNKDNKQLRLITDDYGVLKKIKDEGVLPYNAHILANGNIGVACMVSNWLSYIELSRKGELINVINKNAGLKGTQIIDLYQKSFDPMWLAYYDGPVAKVEAHSPIKQFSNISGIEGVINGIIRIDGQLYAGTSNGIFCLNFTKDGFPFFKRIYESDVWSLLDFKLPNGQTLLLGASFNGVLKIKGNNTDFLCDTMEKIQPFAMSLCQSQVSPERLYIGTSNTVYSIDFKNGKAVNKSIKQLTQPNHNVGEIQSIAEDKFGNVWASSSAKRLICINDKTKGVLSFDQMLEPDQNITGDIIPVSYNDSLFILSGNGIFHFCYEDSTFHKGGIIGNMLDNVSVSKMEFCDSGFFFVCSDKNSDSYWIEYIVRDTLGGYKFSSTPLKRMPKQWVGAMYADDDVFWMGIQKDIYSFDYKSTISTTAEGRFNTLVRRVVFKDSLVFDGAYYTYGEDGFPVISLQQPETQKPRLKYHYNAVVINFSSTFYEKEDNTLYSHYLEGSDEQTWSKWDNKAEATYTNLREGKYTFHVRAKNIFDEVSAETTYSFEIRSPWYRTILAYFVYIVLFVLLIWWLIKWNMRRLIAEKERLEQIVQERTAEVVAQKEEIEGQKIHIEEQNEEIKSSIQYASRIQRAILSPEDQVNTIFPENFILYLPRDIVSGDFYVIMQVGNKKISVVADCTGHGVPGGFMSMLGMSSLSEIINKNSDNLHANIILNLLREKIITSLHQTGEVGTSKDGMDLALYILDETEMTLEFAGANNSLVLIRNDEIIQVKADKMPIGIYLKGNIPFTNNVMEVCKGDVVYTFSDGYADQFGGTDQRKFMIKNLKNLFLEIHKKPMSEQREILDKTLLAWHGDSPRIDDVVVMGVRI